MRKTWKGAAMVMVGWRFCSLKKARAATSDSSFPATSCPGSRSHTRSTLFPHSGASTRAGSDPTLPDQNWTSRGFTVVLWKPVRFSCQRSSQYSRFMRRDVTFCGVPGDLRDGAQRGTRVLSDPSTREPLSRRAVMLAVVLLAFLALKLVHGAIVLTPTFDEYKHSLSGWLYLKTGICCKGQSDTAMVALNGLPWLLSGETPLSAPREGRPF